MPSPYKYIPCQNCGKSEMVGCLRYHDGKRAGVCFDCQEAARKRGDVARCFKCRKVVPAINFAKVPRYTKRVSGTCIDCAQKSLRALNYVMCFHCKRILPRAMSLCQKGVISPHCKRCAKAKGIIQSDHAKRCWCCKTIKLANEFHLDKGSFDGLTSSCKVCNNKLRKERLEKYGRGYAKRRGPQAKLYWVNKQDQQDMTDAWAAGEIPKPEEGYMIPEDAMPRRDRATAKSARKLARNIRTLIQGVDLHGPRKEIIAAKAEAAKAKTAAENPVASNSGGRAPPSLKPVKKELRVGYDPNRDKFRRKETGSGKGDA